MLAVVGAFVLVSGGDDDDGGIDASSAAEAVALLDEDVDAADVESGGTPLGECPVGDLRDLADQAPSGLELVAADGADVQPIAFDVGRRSDPTSFQCNLSDEGGDGGFGALVNVLPQGDVRTFIERGVPDHTVRFEDDAKHRGGKLISYCAKSDGDNGLDFCETDWVGDGIQLGLYVNGDGADADLTSEWLVATLDSMIAELEQLDIDEVVTTST